MNPTPRKFPQDKFTFSDICSIRTINHLAYILGESKKELRAVAENKNAYYKPFIKPGKKGRKIDNPTGKLKHFQSTIQARLLSKSPLPKSMYGGVPKRNTKLNASIHLRKSVLLKLDIKDCFPNTTYRKIYKAYRNHFSYSHQVATILSKLSTYEGHVPQGATLSSTLVNIILIPFCLKLESYSDKNGLVPSVWVDDIAISGIRPEKHIQEIINLLYKYGYSVRTKKIQVLRKHHPQIVTGITTNTKLGVPKKNRAKYYKNIHDKNIYKTKTKGVYTYIRHINPNQAKPYADQSKKVR